MPDTERPPAHEPRPPELRWSEDDAGRRYARERWRSVRRARRDPRLVARILARHLPSGARGLVLDAPCGAGRLRAAISGAQPPGRVLGLDVSAPMLAAARAAGYAALARADLARLPLRDRSVPAVVCCRLLHHVRDPELLARIADELVRVSGDLVVASFWDAGALPERAGRRARARVAHPKALVRAAFERAGARVVEFRHSFRFLSRQTFVVARRPPGGAR